MGNCFIARTMLPWARHGLNAAIVAGILALGTVAPASAQVRPANSVSFSAAGWVFQPAGAKGVTAEFKMPKITCRSTSSGVVPGVFMLTGSPTAVSLNGGYVRVQCSGGNAAAQPGVTVDNEPLFGSGAIPAGNLLKVSVTTSSTKTVATVKDLTAGHTFTLTTSGAPEVAQEELIVDNGLTSGTQHLPVSKFSPVTFTHATVSGKTIGTVEPALAENMETTGAVLQITAGAINTTTENSFTTTWRHA